MTVAVVEVGLRFAALRATGAGDRSRDDGPVPQATHAAHGVTSAAWRVDTVSGVMDFLAVLADCERRLAGVRPLTQVPDKELVDRLVEVFQAADAETQELALTLLAEAVTPWVNVRLGQLTDDPVSRIRLRAALRDPLAHAARSYDTGMEDHFLVYLDLWLASWMPRVLARHTARSAV